MAAIVDAKKPAAGGKKGAPAPELPRFGRVRSNLKVWNETLPFPTLPC